MSGEINWPGQKKARLNENQSESLDLREGQNWNFALFCFFLADLDLSADLMHFIFALGFKALK